MGCHCLLQCMKVKSESEVTQSCPTLSDPMDSGPPGSSIHGIFQARVLEWGAIAFVNSCWCTANTSFTLWKFLGFFFPPNIFDPQLVESADVELTDTDTFTFLQSWKPELRGQVELVLLKAVRERTVPGTSPQPVDGYPLPGPHTVLGADTRPRASWRHGTEPSGRGTEPATGKLQLSRKKQGG